MVVLGFTLFDTAIGSCGIAWSGRGLAGVQLPEANEAATRGRLRRRFPQAAEVPPPPFVQRAAGAICALLSGEANDLSAVALDMGAVSDFDRRVYLLARAIPPGSTLTYGDIAARLGQPCSARAVGKALGRNPFPIVVPCHRVLAAGGRIGGFSSHAGVAMKLRLLSLEGAAAASQQELFARDGARRRAP
jgi:methylated-DNA-[protein]-cysteine S-methyltransferase